MNLNYPSLSPVADNLILSSTSLKWFCQVGYPEIFQQINLLGGITGIHMNNLKYTNRDGSLFLCQTIFYILVTMR